MFGRKINSQKTVKSIPAGLCSLLEVPEGQIFKIVEIRGGQGLHRRLLALGFHPGDLVTLDNEAIMNGPVLVRNLTTETRIGLSRGIAQKIIVEALNHDE
jgi:Fe2+ transport system protein FeoA